MSLRLGPSCANGNGLFLLDAAQTLGHLPIDVAGMQCDLLAAPGHKGLLGPLGTGVLYLGERAMPLVRSRSGWYRQQKRIAAATMGTAGSLRTRNLNVLVWPDYCRSRVGQAANDC